VQLLKSSANDTTQIRQNGRQVVGEKCSESTNEADTLSTSTVKPVEAMPGKRAGSVYYRMAS
jgi:hypothetical protein